MFQKASLPEPVEVLLVLLSDLPQLRHLHHHAGEQVRLAGMVPGHLRANVGVRAGRHKAVAGEVCPNKYFNPKLTQLINYIVYFYQFQFHSHFQEAIPTFVFRRGSIQILSFKRIFICSRET